MSTVDPRTLEPIGRTMFDTEMANDELSVGYHFRRGRCYELAGYALVFASAPEGAILVHGTIDGHEPGGVGRLGHAWLELPDGTIWEPIFGDLWRADDWTAYADARVERRYTLKQAQRKIVQTEHYGRWHDSQYR